MTIPKTSSLIPQDLSKLFRVIKEKTFKTAHYLAGLIRDYSLALYSSLGTMVKKLNPSRVTDITPPKFVFVSKAPKPETVETSVQTEVIQLVQNEVIQPLVLEKKEEPAVVEKQQFPTLKDISDRLNTLSEGRVPDLETSLLKVIASAREVFKTPIVINESLNRQLLDPFQTSVHPEL